MQHFAQLAALTGCSAVQTGSTAFALISPLRFINNLISCSFRVPQQCE